MNFTFKHGALLVICMKLAEWGLAFAVAVPVATGRAAVGNALMTYREAIK